LKRFRLLISLAACVALVVGAWVFWIQSIRSTVVIEAGPKGAFFHETAILIQNELRQYGVDAKIVFREDTVKIIDDVNDKASPVDIGFVSQDVGTQQYPEVTAVATITLEPLFIFYLASLDIKNLEDLKGMRLAVSPPASGTRKFAELVLGLYGVNSQNTTFLPVNLSESAEAIKMGQVDAAFFEQPPDSAAIKALALDPKLRMLSLPQADALASNLSFVRPVTVYGGGFDYLKGIPDRDIRLIAIPVTLIVKKDLKPAIVTIITQSIKTHFQRATLVSKPGEVLLINHDSIVPNQHAETVLKNGLPYIYRTLPFSLAALIDHFSLYIGFAIFLASIYSSMNFPSPKLIWREIQLKWYVGKLQRLFDQVSDGENIEAQDQRLMEKVRDLLDKEESRLRKVSKLLADLQAKLTVERPAATV
jgi:TRAP transporter TAXI family solute receptor